MRSSILQILLIVSIVFSFGATTFAQNDADNSKDKTAIESLVAKYKEYIEKKDAANLLKIISSNSKKNLEKELEKIKEFVKSIPREKQDDVISSFNKTAREISAMDVTAFLKWALSRMSKYDIENMKKTELSDIKFSNDGKSATLTWKGENTVEAPKTAVKEDESWTIELKLS